MTTIKYSVEDTIRGGMREAQQNKDEHDRYLSDYNSLINKTTGTLNCYILDMEGLQRERTTLLAEWKKINADVFEYAGNDFCSVCKQELPEEAKANNKEESLARFNREKAFALEQNTKKGKNVAGQIIQKEEQIAETTAKIEKLKADLDEVRKGWEGDDVPSDKMGEGGVSPAAISFVDQVNAVLKANEEWQKLHKEGTALATKLEKYGPIAVVDTSALDKEISFARANMDEQKLRLSKRDQIKKAEDRKLDLEISQKALSQEIANLEQMEFTIETFIRTKVSMLEERINALFKVVKFKMFNLQINGQLAETCECSIGGVPYSDLNNAARINAGVDIINTMSSKYGIIAPIWIDNRESVNELIPTRAQLINLYVTLDKELIIN